MILIFHGPGTTRVITGVNEVMGFDFLNERMIEGKPFGWFRTGAPFGFGCMPEFFQKRFTHIALVDGPGMLNPGALLWILRPEE